MLFHYYDVLKTAELLEGLTKMGVFAGIDTKKVCIHSIFCTGVTKSVQTRTALANSTHAC
jgi:hypothetical protein